MPSLSRMSSQDLKALLLPVGEFIIYWGIAESALVGILTIVTQKAGGKHLADKLPVSFKRRVKFLRRCFRQVADLTPFAVEMNSILDAANQLVTLRNFIAHGAAISCEDTIYTFWRVDTNDSEKSHYLNELHTTLVDIRNAAADSIKMAKRCQVLNGQLMDTFVRK